jgi:hypothetical protein
VFSGATAAIGVITFVVSLGVRYGTLQSTITTQTKQIEDLKKALDQVTRDQREQVDRLTYAIKAQGEVIVNLRIAVAASAAADEVRSGGTYNRSEVLGVPASKPSRRQAESQARRDALEALDRTKHLDPLAGLDGL